MNAVATFLTANPIILILVALASLWPIVKIIYNAYSVINGIIGRVLGIDSTQLRQFSTDLTHFVASQFASAWSILLLEALIKGWSVTFPWLDRLDIRETKGMTWVIVAPLFLFRFTEAAIVAQAASSAWMVRKLRADK